MNRVKTFDSTGVAPGGKLFAGDLNAIQDAAAAQSDFAQTIDLGTARIGESGLSLSRFGAGEAQLAGDMRVTKILRGLEGVMPGGFTTTQRDAIASGRAPYGLAIINTTKNIWEWNSGTDVSRNWVPFGSQTQVNTLANRPAANSVVIGTQFWATDQAVLYVSDGSAWQRMSDPAGTTAAWFNATAPTGWVKYDGSSLPSSTGIYADLAAHLGGVATPNTKGSVIVGQDAAQTEFDAMKEVGGAKTQALTIANMPLHDHGGGNHGHGLANGTSPVGFYTLGSDVNTTAQSTGSGQDRHMDPTSIAASGNIITGQGSGTGHNNLQPYIVGLYIAKL